MLATIPDTMDKRQGSIIYDALAPAAMELAQLYTNLLIYYDQTYLLTATGINLDNRGGDFAIPRFQATYSERIARTYDFDMRPIDVALGTRYATPASTSPDVLTFVATERLSLGTYIFTAEEVGTRGNAYQGNLLPLFIGNNLGRVEMLGTQRPARDIETDDEYRKRIIERISARAFAGNVADYKRFTKEIAGVGSVKVFPIWAGGGTVKISVTDASYDPIPQAFKDIIKQTIDPEENTGLGIGVAPIGHIVTVDTPQKYLINVECDLTLDNRLVGQVQFEVEAAIDNYLFKLRQNWGDDINTNIFIVLIEQAILSVDRVVNVRNTKINGLTNDLTLTQTAQNQYIPYKGTVVLHG